MTPTEEESLINNLYLSVINSKEAYEFAVEKVKGVRKGYYTNAYWNIGLMLQRQRPDKDSIRYITMYARVSDDYQKIKNNERLVFEFWYRVAAHIDPFFRLGKNPKLDYSEPLYPDALFNESPISIGENIYQVRSDHLVDSIGLIDIKTSEDSDHSNANLQMKMYQALLMEPKSPKQARIDEFRKGLKELELKFKDTTSSSLAAAAMYESIKDQSIKPNQNITVIDSLSKLGEELLKQQKETKMPLVKNVTYIKGVDIKSLSEDGLIQAIKDLEQDLAELDKVKTKSKKLDQRRDEVSKAIETVVAELDSRT